MTTDHRRVDEHMAQEILLDDPAFLREIVERVVQQLLEAEMTEHIGAAPYERSAARSGHRKRLQAEDFEDPSGHTEPACAPGS